MRGGHRRGLPAIMRRTCAVFAVASIVAPAGASAATVTIDIPSTQFNPFRATAVSGDVVRWQNTSVESHVALARNGAFASGEIKRGEEYRSGPIDGPALYEYFCTLHPDMTGEIDVVAALLEAPVSTVAPGSAFELRGRVRGGTSSVTIERLRGEATERVATVTPAADGTFTATVTATETSSYRAVVPTGASAPVEARVSASDTPAPSPTPSATPAPSPAPTPVVTAPGPVPGAVAPTPAAPTPSRPRMTLTVVRGRRSNELRVRVQGGSERRVLAVLEYYERERFAWRAARRSRPDASARVRFRVAASVRRRARVALVRRSDGVRLAVTRPVRL